MYAACIYFTFSSLDLKYMLRQYGILVLIICLFFISQELMFILLGYRVSGLLPFLPLKYGGLDMSSFINYQMTYERSSSFFLEPSHMAQYILPALALSLGQIKNVFNVKNYFIPIVITIIILLSRSGCGAVGAIFIWCFFVLFVNIRTLKKVIFISLACFIAIYAYDKISSTEYGSHMINRTSEFDSNASYERSGIIRVIRGFLVYKDMDISEKILGVGTGGTIDVIDNSKHKYMFFGKERYLNNVQMLLIGFGIFGTVFFLMHLIRLIKKNNLEAKLIMISFVSLSFLESFFMNSKMVLYMSFIFAYKLHYAKKKTIHKDAEVIKN